MAKNILLISGHRRCDYMHALVAHAALLMFVSCGEWSDCQGATEKWTPSLTQ